MVSRNCENEELVCFHFGLDVAPPVADTAASGSDSDDNGEQDHGEQHGVFDSCRAAFAGEEASNCLECFHSQWPVR